MILLSRSDRACRRHARLQPCQVLLCSGSIAAQTQASLVAEKSKGNSGCARPPAEHPASDKWGYGRDSPFPRVRNRSNRGSAAVQASLCQTLRVRPSFEELQKTGMPDFQGNGAHLFTESAFFDTTKLIKKKEGLFSAKMDSRTTTKALPLTGQWSHDDTGKSSIEIVRRNDKSWPSLPDFAANTRIEIDPINIAPRYHSQSLSKASESAAWAASQRGVSS